MTDKMLCDFVSQELNKNNKRFNACVFDDVYRVKGLDVRVEFYNDHKKNYLRLLKFCAENDGLILKTNPATYTTIVRLYI